MTREKKIVIIALLLASTIVLNRFLSIRTSIISIGFSYVPLMIAGIILGYKYTALIGGVADLIGALLFPTGAYFPGFTISGILTGLIYGLLLYRKGEFKVDNKFVIRLIISILLVTVIVNGFLNTIWVIMILEDASKIIIPVRILKQLIMAPIMFVTMYLLTKSLSNKIDGVLND